jgi:demethylmenaquinone methyltransferase/2-methoxy-6-polyprenyl-1,4-benzoquinol methylase
MKILESAPERYDAGMNVLSLGRVSALYDAAAAMAVSTDHARVLEIGCGTGALTRRMLAAGARVEAIDQSPEMLDRARAKLRAYDEPTLLLRESTAAEIDALPASAYDACVACLSLSEMSPDERRFVLEQATRVVRPGGRVVVADETLPRARLARLAFRLLRVPLAVLTWMVTGSTTHALPDIARELRAAGLQVIEERRFGLGSLCAVAARTAGKTAATTATSRSRVSTELLA